MTIKQAIEQLRAVVPAPAYLSVQIDYTSSALGEQTKFSVFAKLPGDNDLTAAPLRNDLAAAVDEVLATIRSRTAKSTATLDSISADAAELVPACLAQQFNAAGDVIERRNVEDAEGERLSGDRFE